MKLLLLVLGLFVLLAAVIISYNVWHAFSEPLVARPGPYELGRQHLHDQLEAARKREAEFERQDWDSVTLLRGLIASHQQRIDRLTGNKEAAEIIAYDRDAITRIQARIADLEAKQREQPAERLSNPEDSAATPSAPKPQPKLAHPDK
ncbi:hypothetical protein DYQ86_11390 [Acidobacteria bacterium AB60]|nr:hypothetical protein DYQ86_11390 [Acidobacteria bacterium AB60]